MAPGRRRSGWLEARRPGAWRAWYCRCHLHWASVPQLTNSRLGQDQRFIYGEEGLRRAHISVFSLLKEVPKLRPGTSQSPVPITPQRCGCPALADPAKFCPQPARGGPRILSSSLYPGLSHLVPGAAEPLGCWSKLKAPLSLSGLKFFGTSEQGQPKSRAFGRAGRVTECRREGTPPTLGAISEPWPCGAQGA